MRKSSKVSQQPLESGSFPKMQLLLIIRTYALTENVRYAVGIFSASTFDFLTHETIITHRRGARPCTPTSLKRLLSVDAYDGQFVSVRKS
jgi:hypothetical protein